MLSVPSAAVGWKPKERRKQWYDTLASRDATIVDVQGTESRDVSVLFRVIRHVLTVMRGLLKQQH